jgi:hypothetical protein
VNSHLHFAVDLFVKRCEQPVQAKCPRQSSRKTDGHNDEPLLLSDRIAPRPPTVQADLESTTAAITNTAIDRY